MRRMSAVSTATEARQLPGLMASSSAEESPMPTVEDAPGVAMDAKLMMATGHGDCQRLKDLLSQQEAMTMVVVMTSGNSNQATPCPTPASMNPLLLASSCFGSWRALNSLIGREDARRSDAVPTQVFLKLLEGNISGASLATVQPQASDHGVEEGPDDQLAFPAGSLLEGLAIGGNTALHAVATFGDGENYLRSAAVIYRKARHFLVTQNNKGDTPLHCAAKAGQSRMVSHFIALAKGEDDDGGRLKELLRKENVRTETALHEAVRIGNKDIVEILMTADSELANFPRDGMSPLYLAILLEQGDIAQSLYDKSDGNLSYSGPNGQNALHAAALRSEVMTKMLLRWNIGLTEQADQNGSTPLHFAISMLHPRRLHFWMFHPWWFHRGVWHSSMTLNQVLQANIAPMYQPDHKGLFPIHIAASVGVNKGVVKLLKKCPNVAGLCDIKGRTFLHVATEKKKWNIVAHVCQTPSLSWILNMQDNDGNTALHLSVKLEDLDTFSLLLENRKVRLNLTNNRGETPLDLSESRIRAGSLSRGISGWINPRFFIDVALKYCHAKYGNRRLDHFEEQYVQPEDEEKEQEKLTNSTQTLGIASMLITTVAFGATFTLPGGYKGDGTPTLSGRYAFDAFIVANSLAFGCSGLATINHVYSGIAVFDVPLRTRHFDMTIIFAFSAVTSLATAFVLGLYLVLAPVAHMTATLVCVVASVISVFGFMDPIRGYAVGRALRSRIGTSALTICARVLFIHTLIVFSPLMMTFGWAAISTKYHHK